MTEKPTKLFPGRADLYPEPDAADQALGDARAAIAFIPVFGGPINEVLSLVLAPSVARRRDEWFKDLASIVDKLERELEGFKPEDLAKNEAFVSATIQATRVAAATDRREKREMLHNALLKIAMGTAPSEELQQVFLDAVDSFTCSHVKVLEFLRKGDSNLKPPIVNYGQAIQTAVPELKGQPDFIQLIMNDLRNRGFSPLIGPGAAHPQHPAVTNMGIDFLNFVLEP